MSSRNVYIAAAVACMTASIFGYSVGFIGGVLVLPSFMHHFHLDELSEHQLASARSIVVSVWLTGALSGVLGAMPVCQRLGRKNCLAFSATLYVVGAVLQLVPTRGGTMAVFEVGRLLNGLGVGAGTLVSPIYISEISSPALRATLMSGYQVAMQICALVGFWGAFASHAVIHDSSDFQWQVPVILQLLPGAILLLGSLYVPESPVWLVERQEMASAQRALAWLCREPEESPQVANELDDLHRMTLKRRTAESLRPKSSSVRQLLHKPIRKRLGVGIGLMALQTLSGTNALNFYAPTIFMNAGFASVSASLFLTGVFGLMKLIASLAFMTYIVRIKGNRFWLLLGSAICSGSMYVLAYCVHSLSPPLATRHDHLDTSTSASASASAQLTFTGLLACLTVFSFAFFFGIGIGPISWNVCAEIFPTHLNTLCCAITTCVQWVCQIISAVSTPYLIATAGGDTYVIFGTICAVTFVWCAIYVPETRGVKIGPEMDAVFDDGGKDEVVGGEEVESLLPPTAETPLLAARERRRSEIVVII